MHINCGHVAHNDNGHSENYSRTGVPRIVDPVIVLRKGVNLRLGYGPSGRKERFTRAAAPKLWKLYAVALRRVAVRGNLVRVEAPVCFPRRRRRSKVRGD